MTCNLLLWKWSDDYDTPAKRKKAKLKFSDVTNAFADTGHHPAIGKADMAAFRAVLEAEFGADEVARPFVLELFPDCASLNYTNAVRFDLVPKIAKIGRKFGLNASEF